MYYESSLLKLSHDKFVSVRSHSKSIALNIFTLSSMINPSKCTSISYVLLPLSLRFYKNLLNPEFRIKLIEMATKKKVNSNRLKTK